MELKSIERIQNLISSSQIYKATDELRKFIADNALYQFKDRLENIIQTYNFMIHYMLEDVQDTGRKDLYQSIIADLKLLCDSIKRHILLKEGTDLYYAEARIVAIRNMNLPELVKQYNLLTDKIKLAGEASVDASRMHSEREIILQDIFRVIWTSHPISSHSDLICSIMSDEDSEYELRCQIISALLLGGLMYFDADKIKLLLSIYESVADITIKARALTALVILISAGRNQISENKELQAALSSILDEGINSKRVKTVVAELERTSDTDRITKQLKEDVIPKIKNISPSIMERFKDSGLDGNSELNPEWEDVLKESGLDKQLNYLTELQSEGADVMMLPFANLKVFPFFNLYSNWFLPFDTNYSELKSVLEPESPYYLILNTPGMMCDSDKYSLALSLARVPAAQKEMMIKSIEGQQEMLRENLNQAEFMTAEGDIRFHQAVSLYLRDIYRFFKLFRHRNQFTDIFAVKQGMINMPVIYDIIVSDNEMLRLLGEFYLKRELYSQAASMFDYLDKNGSADPADFEKLGYCCQKTGDYYGAMSWYRKAQLFKPDSLWLLKRMAFVSRKTGQYADAIELYNRAIEAEPENISLIMNLGSCLLEDNKPEEALKRFYKANYIKPEHTNSLRAIAWVEMLRNNFEQSENYYNRLLEKESPSGQDYMNAGILAIVNGSNKKAFGLFQKALSTPGFTMQDLINGLNNDMATMISLGADNTVISLIIDKLRAERETK